MRRGNLYFMTLICGPSEVLEVSLPKLDDKGPARSLKVYGLWPYPGLVCSVPLFTPNLVHMETLWLWPI